MRRFDRPPIERRLEQPEQFGPEGFEAHLRGDEQERGRPFVERQPGEVGVGLIFGQAAQNFASMSMRSLRSRS